MKILFKNYFYSISLITLCLLSSGCESKDKKNAPTEAPPVKVSVLTVEKNDNTNKREYSGTVSSSTTTTVSFSVGGTIKELNIKEGQKISKGQVIGRIDNGDYVNSNNMAQAELAQAKDAYERLKKLHDSNALPDIKWVEIQQKLKQAGNAAEITQRTLNDATLHSPVSGTISRKFVEAGQSVVPVEPVCEIISSDNLTINIAVAENEISSFNMGEKAQIEFDSTDISPMEGKVTQKSVTADPLTRAFTVKIDISSQGGKVLPGMTGNVYFEAEKSSENNTPELTLPSQAVLLDADNRNFVWIVKNGMAERRFVTADELVANGVTIKSGLNPGDSIIVAGMQKVGTGSKVITE